MRPSSPAGPVRLQGPAGVACSTSSGGWRAVMSAALVLAFSAWSRTDWAMAREESLRQRCSFVAALLAVGVRLWLAPFDGMRHAGRGRPVAPGRPVHPLRCAAAFTSSCCLRIWHGH